MGDPGMEYMVVSCPSQGPGTLGSVFSPHHQRQMAISTDVTVILKLRQPLGQQKREEVPYARLP